MTGLTVKKSLVLATAGLVMLCGLTVTPAFSEGFPGKGDPSDWSDALPYYNLANKYLSKDRYEDAIQKYQEAIARYPYDADFYVNLGVAYRKMDDYVSAEIAYKKAIELNDKDWSAWSDLANSYLKQNRLKETIATFEKAIKCNPPKAEKAAMTQDIGDITKILRIRGELPMPNAARATASKKPLAARVPVKAAVIQTTRLLSEKSTTPPSKTPSSPGAKPQAELNGSGWDYVYK